MTGQYLRVHLVFISWHTCTAGSCAGMLCCVIHIFSRHRPIDTLLAACGTIVVGEDMTPFISRMEDLNASAPAAADAAAAGARKSLDIPILLSFAITTLVAFLFQSIIMRSSTAISAAAAVAYAAAPATLIYPHRYQPEVTPSIFVIAIGIIIAITFILDMDIIVTLSVAITKIFS